MSSGAMTASAVFGDTVREVADGVVAGQRDRDPAVWAELAGEPCDERPCGAHVDGLVPVEALHGGADYA